MYRISEAAKGCLVKINYTAMGGENNSVSSRNEVLFLFSGDAEGLGGGRHSRHNLTATIGLVFHAAGIDSRCL